MASYRRGSRRRYDPYADERRAEEERREQQKRQTRARLDRLLRQFRRVRLSGEAADRAWSEPQLRSFTIGESGGVPVQAIVRGSRGQLFLQEPGFAGWSLYRLVPRYHTPRESEVFERDRRRRR